MEEASPCDTGQKKEQGQGSECQFGSIPFEVPIHVRHSGLMPVLPVLSNIPSHGYEQNEGSCTDQQPLNPRICKTSPATQKPCCEANNNEGDTRLHGPCGVTIRCKPTNPQG